MNKRDKIGERGEKLFETLMTTFDTPNGPLFNPHFLGAKWPVLDFYVECENVIGPAPFFFVQVKATRANYTKTGRLKASIDMNTAQTMSAHRAPAYVVGVDIDNGRGYIISANSQVTKGLASMPQAGLIDKKNRLLLWSEVVDYWNSQAPCRTISHFTDPKWR